MSDNRREDGEEEEIEVFEEEEDLSDNRREDGEEEDIKVFEEEEDLLLADGADFTSEQKILALHMLSDKAIPDELAVFIFAALRITYEEIEEELRGPCLQFLIKLENPDIDEADIKPFVWLCRKAVNSSTYLRLIGCNNRLRREILDRNIFTPAVIQGLLEWHSKCTGKKLNDNFAIAISKTFSHFKLSQIQDFISSLDIHPNNVYNLAVKFLKISNCFSNLSDDFARETFGTQRLLALAGFDQHGKHKKNLCEIVS